VRATFSKRERLVSRKLTEQLFSKGSSHSTTAFPLRAVFLKRERESDGVPVQVLVSVSKRHFKHAVDRNRVKRQIREAYRHGKQLLTARVPDGESYAVAFIWLADRHFDSVMVQRSVARLLEKIAERV